MNTHVSDSSATVARMACHDRGASVEAETIQQLLEAALDMEPPSASTCLRLAESYAQTGNAAEARRWAARVVDAGDGFGSWQMAASLLRNLDKKAVPPLRVARTAIIGSSTTAQFAQLLPLAAARLGLELAIYEGNYGQYRQEILDPSSSMYAFEPRFVILAVDQAALQLPDCSDEPRRDVEEELHRWTTLWQTVRDRAAARVVQFNFVTPCEQPWGHLAARLPGSRYCMTQSLNARLGEAAGNDVSILDCERLAGTFGKARWFDPRYWFSSKQAISLDALPLLARHTAAVIAADLGLARKCVVLDLDNTLWGGVIGEDHLIGIRLGHGVEGEAFVAFQEYLLQLKRKGVVLAVCSKNNEADAKSPFLRHPDMRLKLDDIAVFVANWQPKPDNIRRIAETLNLGLDAFVFLDDNPAERSAVRWTLPDVDVVPLPSDPTQYARALSQCLTLETSSLTGDDARRTEQYRARARVQELKQTATSLDEFYRSLKMKAIVAPFDELHLPRIAQLIAKTNQFNVTTRRHGMQQVRLWLDDPRCIHLFLRLRDRFTDHGVVGLVIAFHRDDVLDIDTLLMSCRVIGRTVEATLMQELCERAMQCGCRSLHGTYIPTKKNDLVRDFFPKLGFSMLSDDNGTRRWHYDLHENGPIQNEFIETVESLECVRNVAHAT